MYNNPRFRIAVLPGDGIGPEVVQSCLTILEVLCERLGGISFDFRQREGGAGHYEKTGAVFSDDTLAECRDADAVLLGAMGLPRVCYPDGTEVSAHFDLRMAMDIYAGLRPIRGYPRLPLVLADQRAAEIDLVVVREQSEGLLSSHGCGTLEDDRVRETMVVSRHGSRRVVEFAFELAGR
ncbi:MAG: 3-isopropylmalate dehydrogenase, partial [Candidatus Accumulibacter phosphatis]|nr:3-isopropylmalate dehydrogenase [Candidatus Accumulibacter phosphatis]